MDKTCTSHLPALAVAQSFENILRIGFICGSVWLAVDRSETLSNGIRIQR